MNNEKVIITTERFKLVEWQASDLPQLKEILQDKTTMWAYDKSYNDEDCLKWLEWNIKSYHDNGFGLWKIVNKTTNEIVGQCGITCQTVEDESYPEIGYQVKNDYWRQGMAYEVATAVEKFGFNQLHFKELVIICGENNIPSMNVAIKLGFKIKKQFTENKPRPHYLFYKRINEKI